MSTGVGRKIADGGLDSGHFFHQKYNWRNLHPMLIVTRGQAWNNLQVASAHNPNATLYSAHIYFPCI